MVYAAVLAGGSGLRMGGEIPKQFLLAGSRPVIIRSLDAFLSNGNVDRVYAAVSAEYTEYLSGLTEKYIGKNEVEIVCGGKNRNETLFNVLKSIKEQYGICDDDVILTHDAVRPFINDRIINENIASAREYGACDTVIPAVDTIVKSADGKFIDAVPVRSELFHGQTPQSFNVSEIFSLYENMTPDEFELYTDACTVFIKNGKKVALVQGDRNNIKLTYPEDMEKAEMILKNGRK